MIFVQVVTLRPRAVGVAGILYPVRKCFWDRFSQDVILRVYVGIDEDTCGRPKNATAHSPPRVPTKFLKIHVKLVVPLMGLLILWATGKSRGNGKVHLSVNKTNFYNNQHKLI
jgi:hypothetical protein